MSLRQQTPPTTGFLPQAVEDMVRMWVYRAAGVGLGLTAIVTWLCLATWTAQTGSDLSDVHRNVFGPLGSVVADLLFQSLGLTSVLAMLPLVFFGVELFRLGRVALLSARMIFWPLAVVLLAGGFSAIPTPAAWPLQHGFGGLIGDFLFGFMRQIVDTIEPTLGGLIAAVALWLTGGAMLLRALNLRPGDLSILLEFEPRTEGQVAPGTKTGFLQRLFGGSRGRSDTSRPASPAEAMTGHYPGPMARTAAFTPQQTIAETPPPPTVYVSDEIPVQTPPAAFDDDPESREMAARFAPGAKAARKARAVEPVAEVADARLDDVETQVATPRFMERVTPSATQAVEMPSDRQRHDGAYKLPSVNLLARGSKTKNGAGFADNVMRGNAHLLQDVLADFGIKGEIVGVHPGPVVTLYELEPARGIKASRVIGLADDIARSMSAHSARIAVVPGKNVIGIELPNTKRVGVMLRDLIEDPAFSQSQAKLPMSIGKAIDGAPIVTDLARMPHLLVAGTTGSGKSVGINAMILSLLYRHTPQTCRFIMIDPKMLELSVYNGIPHLLTPVVTDPRKAVLALNWAVREMEERYKRMSELGVRNMDVYNARIADAQQQNKPIHRTVQTGFDPDTGEPVYEDRIIAHTPMAAIVIVIDEMADLMMTAGKEIEATIQRLAQMARAAGLHLITATQRPSVDVITGTIKANLPTRISFKVTTATDSRTILGQQGAEQLLGAGDMLFSQGGGQISRVHGPFVSEDEVEAVVTHLSRQGTTDYVPEITEEPVASPAPSTASSAAAETGGPCELYDKAVAIVLRDGKASTSYIQRRLSIGYNRAADLIERMEADGVISAANATGRREILADQG